MQLGVIGLGRMGSNITRRLTAHGHECVVFDRDAHTVSALADRKAIAGAGSLEELVKQLKPPRAVWVMLPAGRATEETVATLAGLMSRDDVIIDGGNSFWQDDIRRAKAVAAQGIHYVDAGTSGGIWGLERGYCLMIGGDKAVVDRLDPIFAVLAPGSGDIPPTPHREKRDPRPEKGYLHAGPVGAGHFVKMVHNGIEYGLMQAYAEGFDILQGAASDALPEEHRFTLNLPDIAEVWRRGSVISSWLLDLTAAALAEDEGLKTYTGYVEDSGEGRWTIHAAVEEAVPADVLSAALYARFRSREPESFPMRLLSAMRKGFGGHVEPKATGAPVQGKEVMAPAPDQKALRQANPCSFVIFGASGDLTARLLMPALYRLAAQKRLPDGFAVVGLAHSHRSDDEFRGTLKQAIEQHVGEKLDAAAVSWLIERVSYVQGEFEDPASYDRLDQALKKIEADRKIPGNRLFYLATPPAAFVPIVKRLGEKGLAEEKDPKDGWHRIIIEKPFGTDLISAQALNRQLLNVFAESQIYRIDHFLGKETVQNIMALRFANGIFESLWNRDRIDHVQITAAETVDVAGRGKFYDATGALRDMVPNHLFQIMTLVAMEPPTSFVADEVRAEKAKVLHAVHPFSSDTAMRDAVRGQYGAGKVAGKDVVAYREAPDVSRGSTTETYVALRLMIDNWRWAGVPFYLRTGKSLVARRTEVAIKFKEAPFTPFRDTPIDSLGENFAVIRIQPDEGVALQFNAKVPGPQLALGGVRMDFKYKDYFDAAPSNGYETLLFDSMIGDMTLFQQADEIETGWRIVQPFLDDWHEAPARDLAIYPAGSEGPSSADDLMARDGRHWRRIEVGQNRP